MSKLNLFFDLDDTLLDTLVEIRKYLLRDYGFTAPVDTFLTLENTNGLVQLVLDNPKFMSTVEPHPSKKELLSIIRSEYGDRVSLNFCTHRGYHPDCETLTEELLARHELTFDRKIYLHPGYIPDKMKYLREFLKVPSPMLVDDNPYFNADIKVHDGNTYLLDKPWNQHLSFGSNRVYSNECILDKIEKQLIACK